MATAIDHLRVAHHLALAALHAGDVDAASLVRAWPHLAGAAHTACSALPHTRDDEDRIIERIALDAGSLAAAADHHQLWPGDVPPDAARMRVAAVLGVAAGADTARMRPADVPEAHRLIVSSL